MFTKHIKDVEQNEILGEDIFSGGTLLIKRGTVLSKRMIDLLKKRDVENVKTMDEAFGPHKTEVVPLAEDEVDLPEISVPQSNHNKTQWSTIKTEENVRDTFFEMLSYVGSEHRYGKLLNLEEDIYFLMNMFTRIHKKYDFMETIYALKTWDNYAFVHSFDVFILGTIMAKRLGLQNLESVALGYLFHDIGKMKTPQDILHKPRKLTYAEFATIKKHTIEGEAILRSLGQDHIAHFARSHHERMDGSGYPDYLTVNDLETDLRIMQIVDVYSALTLKRPYKNELPAQEAIQILLRDKKQFDEKLLLRFIDALTIYPFDATVLLSDNTPAKIKKVNKLSPILPYVTRMNQKAETFSLPLDFSVTVSHLIDYQSKTFQTRYTAFVNYILKGNKHASFEEFAHLIDGLQLEDIYTSIILPAYWDIVKLTENNSITDTAFYKSNAVLMEVLAQLDEETIKSNDYRRKTLFVMKRDEEYTVPIKVLLGLMHLEGVFPLVMNSDLSVSDLQKYAFEYDVERICPINIEDITRKQFEYLNVAVTHKSYSELNQLLTDITAIKGQSLQIYERLFGLGKFVAIM